MSFKIVAPDDLKDVIGSVVSPTISDDILPPVLDNYDNVPAHYLSKHNLKPLTVGSNAWLSHMKEIYDIYVEDMKYEQGKTDAGLRWDTTSEKGIYQEGLCNMLMEYTTARHDYELKLLEVSSNTQTVPVSLKKSEQRKREKELQKKILKDNEILERLRDRVDAIDHAIYTEYHQEEVGLKFEPCAIMNDRPLV
uniref:Uncharacterized protein n=1 Tax=Rhizophagus irregularis (strain DAOM 181602 / DAOM 197198 / MUCL 43194) TaxID=747089 RepID=U9TT89_RHIID